ncbi:MAG TPA: hypothetical protein ENK21_06410 [Trueperaceae bacterium]|nr:hypothetical protein [Trueperaceae bacterium]
MEENETIVVENSNNWLLVLLLLAIMIGLAYSFWQTSSRLAKLEQNLASIQESVPQIPQATIDAIIALQNGSQPQPAAQQAPSNPQGVKISLNDEEIYGSKDAPIAIVEFSDFNCPFCSRFHTQTLPKIIKDYVDQGKVAFVYKDYIGVGGNMSMDAAIAAECAREQIGNDKYLGILEQVYASPGRKNRDLVVSLAEKLSVDMDALNSCIKEDKYRQQVADDTRLGQVSGIRGTPGFVIGKFKDGEVVGTVVAGAQPYEVFQSILDKGLASQ